MAKSTVIACGAYIPYLRLARQEYVSALGGCSADLQEKAVPDIDEDVLTMAVAAARNALAGVDPGRIGVLVLASTSFPCQEKFMAGTLVEALGLPSDVLTGHFGHSILAGAEAFLASPGLLDLTDRPCALVVIADAPAATGELEQAAGGGACAFVLARQGAGLELEGAAAYAAEYPGLRYRLPGDIAVRDIGVPAYAAAAAREVSSAALGGLLQKLGAKPSDYGQAVLPQSGAKAYLNQARQLGFSAQQAEPGLIYSLVGDCGAATPFLGLCRVLEQLDVGQRILLLTSAPGSGSCALSFKLTGPLLPPAWSVNALLERKKYLSYVQYLRLKGIV
ncbi:hypothetical protein [Desulfurispora thermophila]|uniref:hypothetical protein n=1 Tax=Desulfurispora thermophila TaxID=265470 RepID=UPI00037751CB|nr:hypothetical protein [Desulfurispora thermophila]